MPNVKEEVKENDIVSQLEDSELAEFYKSCMSEVKEGEIVTGKVIEINDREVIIDIGYKSEGIIPTSEFLDINEIKVGDDIEVYLESKEDEDGSIIVSRKKAERTQGWEKLVRNCKEGDVIEGKIVKYVKGGYTVDIGVEAFLPSSQSGIRLPQDKKEDFLFKTMMFKVIKINKPRKNVVLSRKEVLSQEKESSKQKFIEELSKGSICKGVVKNITDFGAFVNLGVIDGLLHITDMKWGRIKHPSEMLKIGDEIDVMILDIDNKNKRVSLGLKQKTESPWKDAESKYPVGTKVKGTVVNIVAYGVFIELNDGIEGLVHISELSWTKRVNHPQEILSLGDVVEAVVLSIDAENEKLSLGIKQIEENPWLKMSDRYKTGTVVKGKIKNFVDYGVFVELEAGLEGLLHVSDISWTKKLSNVSELYKVGQELDVMVLGVDQEAKRIALGVKQLQPDPWKNVAERFQEGNVIAGKISKITKFGLFVKLDEEIEGLVHVSEAGIDETANIDAFFKVNDEVSAKIIKVDGEQRKISLSLKQR